jgi:hypothetical protein
MNKTSILIAMFAVITAASSAMAQIEFDGKSPRTNAPKLAAAIIEQDPGFDTPIPQPIPGYIPGCGDMVILPWPQNSCTDGPLLPQDCSQTDTGSWWWVAVCGEPLPWYAQPGYLEATTGSARTNPAEKAAAKAHFADLILGYANTYPEFAATVMPALKDKKANVVYDRKGAYVMSGKTVVRMDFEKLSHLSPAAPLAQQTKIAPALEAALYIVETGAALYGAYQAWNEYHSSDNDSGSGNNGSYNGGNVQPNIHQTEWEIQHNIQRMGAAH